MDTLASAALSTRRQFFGLFPALPTPSLLYPHLALLGRKGESLLDFFECSDDVDKRKHFIHIGHAMQLAGFKKDKDHGWSLVHLFSGAFSGWSYASDILKYNMVPFAPCRIGSHAGSLHRTPMFA